MQYRFILCLLMVFGCTSPIEEPVPVVPEEVEIRGADMSYYPEIKQRNVLFYNEDKEAEDMLLSLKKAGANVIRLRLWKNPTEATSNFETVKALSQQIKLMGLKTLITVHYSDTWADPSHQTKPEQWKNASFSALKDSVFAYTKMVMQEMQPNYIQIGNEINGGFLWDEGSYRYPMQLKELIQSASAAIRASQVKTKIIIHFAGYTQTDYMLDRLAGIDYDILGISYYPLWHGKSLEDLKANLISLSEKHNKPIFIAETSYPFTLQWNDWTNNVIGGENQLLPAYPPTAIGQAAFLQKIKELVREVPKGIGFCYWGTEWVSYKGNNAQNGSSWENQSLWDFNNTALPAIKVFAK